MKLSIGDYQIESDSLNFILQKKKIIKESKLTKAENVGKEVWEDVGYYSNISPLLKAIPTQIFLDNDELSVIADKLREVYEKIEDIERILSKTILDK